MQQKRGFTIIEVMLFLAITGLLIGGILGGTTQSLNAQRYRSGVEALRNTIREQYETSLSLRNLTADNGMGDTNGVDPCDVIDSSSGTPMSTNHARGTSNCLYVGRLILLQANTSQKISQLTVYPVVAKVVVQGVSGIFRDASGALLPAAPAGGNTDQNSLHIAAFTDNKNIIISKPVDWGLVAVTPGTDQVMNIGILVFRSPLSGTVTTYVIKHTDTLPPDYLRQLQNYMKADPTAPDSNIQAVKLCMADLTGPLDQAQRMAITISAGATGPSGVETLGEAAQC